MPKRVRIKSGERVPLLVTEEERELICDETLADDELTEPLRLAEAAGRKLKAWYTLDELEDLHGFVSAAANHAEGRARQAKLDRLLEGMEKLQETYIDPAHRDY